MMMDNVHLFSEDLAKPLAPSTGREGSEGRLRTAAEDVRGEVRVVCAVISPSRVAVYPAGNFVMAEAGVASTPCANLHPLVRPVRHRRPLVSTFCAAYWWVCGTIRAVLRVCAQLAPGGRAVGNAGVPGGAGPGWRRQFIEPGRLDDDC